MTLQNPADLQDQEKRKANKAHQQLLQNSHVYNRRSSINSEGNKQDLSFSSGAGPKSMVHVEQYLISSSFNF
jgi:hypothetical protein